MAVATTKSLIKIMIVDVQANLVRFYCFMIIVFAMLCQVSDLSMNTMDVVLKCRVK